MSRPPSHPTRPQDLATDTHPDAPPAGDRWSTWDTSTHGPGPRPSWVVTDLAAVDEDLGVLRTGKEADVHVVRRWLPNPARPGEAVRETLMAAKRYRPGERRLFHRDAGYLEGRRVRRSREARAMARRTEFGREVIAGQWAAAEFHALARLWTLGLPVPYPVQLDHTEMLMELVASDGVAAPRLADTRLDRATLDHVWRRVLDCLERLAGEGWAHGDLSAYNIIVRDGEPVLIDWPQIVDVVGNPGGFEFLRRDVVNLATWFTTRGVPVDPDEVFSDLAARVAGQW